MKRIPIEEALLQIYLFAGYPRAIEALARLADNWPRASRAKAVPEDEWRSRGEALCRKVYGRNYEKLHDNIGTAHPDLGHWMVDEGYGKVLSRPGLDSVSRELCTVAALGALDAPRQLLAHMIGARNVGARSPEIGAAITLSALGCGVRTWRRSVRHFEAFVAANGSGGIS